MRTSALCIALTAITLLVVSAEDARADFLILNSGESFGGKLIRYEDGTVATSKTTHCYGPEFVARVTEAKTVDDAIEEWAKAIGDETSEEAREARLILGKFCVFHGKYDEAEKYFEAWAKPRKWKVFATKYFFVLSDAKEKRVKEVRERLDAVMRFYRKEFGTKRKLNRDFVVRFFKSEAEFDAFARENDMSGAGAYYDPNTRELVLYDVSTMSKRETFKSVYHEANHQFVQQYVVGSEAGHTWFAEGLATYYETLRCKGGKIVDSGKKQIDYQMTLKESLRRDEITPWEELLAMPYGKFHCGGSRESLHYAQAWGLIYFFKNTKNRKCRGFFDRYLETLSETRDEKAALAAACKVASTEEIDRAFRAFQSKL